jgi:hypothetical protein
VERRGGAFLPGLESDTHQSQFAKMKMMGFYGLAFAADYLADALLGFALNRHRAQAPSKAR